MTAYGISFIVAAGLFLGVCAGFVMHRSDFCIAGMVRDLFLFGFTAKLRALVLLVVISMLLFEGGRLSGLLPPRHFAPFGPASLTNVLGGFAFGIGMVLAGGCVVGTLYKMGAGSVLSAVAFLGLIMGSGLYGEIHPWWRSFMVSTTVWQKKITLPQLLDVPPSVLIIPLAAGAALLFYRWYRQGLWTLPLHAEGSLQPWLAAVLLSLVGLAFYVVIGKPLGITTAYAKMAAYAESFFWQSHLDGLTYFAELPLKYRHPFLDLGFEGGPGAHMDGIALTQFPVIVGIALGGLFSAVSLREFRFYGHVPFRQYLSALVGGIVMGLASRLAPACNIWHLLSGLPMLVLQSSFFLVGMFPGAWLGGKLLTWFVIK